MSACGPSPRGSIALSGSGTVAGNTTILGDLQPGSSPGTLTFTGNLGLESGSDWLVELEFAVLQLASLGQARAEGVQAVGLGLQLG